MRGDLTYPEQLLWRELRKLEIDGSHFRRQAAFGNYIVDFVCHGARLVIEVDGAVHICPRSRRAILSGKTG